LLKDTRRHKNQLRGVERIYSRDEHEFPVGTFVKKDQKLGELLSPELFVGRWLPGFFFPWPPTAKALRPP